MINSSNQFNYLMLFQLRIIIFFRWGGGVSSTFLINKRIFSFFFWRKGGNYINYKYACKRQIETITKSSVLKLSKFCIAPQRLKLRMCQKVVLLFLLREVLMCVKVKALITVYRCSEEHIASGDKGACHNIQL